ncbi:MAG: hypothetical protein N3D11_09335 [Candidatus Sumerlaeia bacterium]|nr:hypothetical protein [Candidatus Sumerlaeia bacterium]
MPFKPTMCPCRTVGLRLAAGVLAVALCGLLACRLPQGRLAGFLGARQAAPDSAQTAEETSPTAYVKMPLLPGWLHFSKGGALIRQSIEAYGGSKAAAALREGLEIEAVWKTPEADRVAEDPALIQMVVGPPMRIRIHFTKVDQVFAAGDQGPWVMMGGKGDKSPEFVGRAQFTAAMMAFFLSLPFNLKDPGVVIRDVTTRTYAGDTFDIATVIFHGGDYPYPDDVMMLWFKRPTYLLDRCFWVSTAPHSSFGPPPNYVWIFWQNHGRVRDVMVARRWSFVRSEASGALRDKMFDIEINDAIANRAFLPVLFRQPIIEPVVQRVTVGKEKITIPQSKKAKP